MHDYEQAKNALSKLDEGFSENADYDFDFQDLCFDIVEELMHYESSHDATRAVFECLEKQPTGNFGVHAELFRFLESRELAVLEKGLLESLNRKPVPQTVWLVKKLCNTYQTKQDNENSQKWHSILEEIAASESVDNATREKAKMFLAH